MAAEVERDRLDVRAQVGVALAAQAETLDGGAVADARFVAEGLHASARVVALVAQRLEELLEMRAVHESGLASPELGRIVRDERLEVEEAVGAAQRDLVVEAGHVVLLAVGTDHLAHANLHVWERACASNQKLAKLSIVGYHMRVKFYGNSSL